MSKATSKDRISNLPEDVLHYILSFLTITNGARTSILSKRWNYIWTTVPTLHFRGWKVGSDIPCSSQSNKFMDFVDGTLHRHKLSDVHKFSLSWFGPLNQSRIHSWISNVIRGNVRELSLNLRQKDSSFIPLSLFTYKSLISLELKILYIPNFTLPAYISLPRLKCLRLKGFEFRDEYWNGELFSNFPVLEELALKYCKFRMRNFCILIPSLKFLKIDAGCSEGNELGDCVFKINAPELVTFSYSGYVAKEFVLSSFQALAEASVYFQFQENVGAEAKSQLLCALAHVKFLTVSDQTLQAICAADDLSNNLLTFQNVKRLNISDVLYTDRGLIALLKALPNLESLVFYHMNDEVVEDNDEEDESNNDEDDSDCSEGDGDDDSEDHNPDFVEGANNHINEGEGYVADAAECRSNDESEDINEGEGYVTDAAECRSNDESEVNYDGENESWALDIPTAGCLFPHLKSVFFQEFAGNPREMKWVRLILRDAKALQIMNIRYCGGSYDAFEKELKAEIPSFPRTSSGCVIKFYSWR